jgi:hypothetical protein
MRNDLAYLQKKFPISFPIERLPDGAKEQDIDVYRICETGLVEQASFIPTYQTELAHTKGYDPNDPGSYSLSTYIKEKDVRGKLKCMKKYHPHPILAKGKTASSCGMSQITKDRKSVRDSHVDWWLYEESQPHLHFHEI